MRVWRDRERKIKLIFELSEAGITDREIAKQVGCGRKMVAKVLGRAWSNSTRDDRVEEWIVESYRVHRMRPAEIARCLKKPIGQIKTVLAKYDRVYFPSPEEIAAEAAKIREGWSDAELLHRSGSAAPVASDVPTFAAKDTRTRGWLTFEPAEM